MKKCLLLIVQLFLIGQFKVHGVHRFGYSNFEQRKWRQQHSSCGGNMQSPIRIDTFRAIPLRMPAVEMVRYHDYLPGPLELRNNGHSVSLSIPKLQKDDPYVKYIPYVFGGRLHAEYELEGLHFHWGDTNSYGSEHILNDVRYPIEMHIVHRNRKYESVAEALNHADGLTVLGIFFQIKEKENKNLSPIVRNLWHVHDVDSVTLLNETFTLASLIPPVEEMERFYTYKGSLTTPPCSEAVTWILFPDPLPISVYQMNKFRHLASDTNDTPLLNNYRHLQSIGSRRVFVRKLKPRDIPRNNDTIFYDKWDWLMKKH
ncbi:Eukaryotic-type carbonic anhydrase [Popillia japonica]|uniref:Carbonic anhydrase n=1 Tax=Popillia japonica TaxID=7064 RepID=A0AAW1ISL8_POPJA